MNAPNLYKPFKNSSYHRLWSIGADHLGSLTDVHPPLQLLVFGLLYGLSQAYTMGIFNGDHGPCTRQPLHVCSRSVAFFHPISTLARTASKVYTQDSTCHKWSQPSALSLGNEWLSASSSLRPLTEMVNIPARKIVSPTRKADCFN